MRRNSPVSGSVLLSVSLFASAAILALGQTGCAIEESTSSTYGSDYTDTSSDGDTASPDDIGVEHVGSPDLGDEDTGLVDDDTGSDEPSVPTLYVEFVDRYGNSPVTSGARSAYMGTMLLTAEGGDVFLRGMMLRGYVDANGDESFSSPAEWGMAIPDYLEDIFLWNVGTALVQYSAVAPNSDALIVLADVNEFGVLDGQTREFDVYAGVSADVPVVEGASLAVGLGSPNNVWTSNDVDVVLVSDNEVSVYFE